MTPRRLWFFLQLAGRDMRGPSRARLVFTSCLALGVAVMTCVGGLSATLDYSLKRQVKHILGGDIELSTTSSRLPSEAQTLANFYGSTSNVVELNIMVASGGKREMVELKAVDGPYPLYGSLSFKDKTPRHEIFPRSRRNGQFGAAVSQRLLDDMDLKIGDVLMIGKLDVEIRAVIAREPDRFSAGLFSFGPRIMINSNAFAGTGLAESGRNVTYRTRIKTLATSDIDQWYTDARAKTANITWVTRDWRNALPGLTTLLDRLNLFFTLMALTTLVTSGIGIGNATVAYMRNRRRTMAVLSCLGATPQQIRLTYALQLSLLAFHTILTGVLLGIAGQLLILNALGNELPITIEGALFFKPMLVATAFGALTVVIFSCIPLDTATTLRPALLFRSSRAVFNYTRPGWLTLLIIAAAALGMFRTAAWATHDATFTLWYGLCLAAVLLGFMLLAMALRALASRLAHSTSHLFSLRMALISFSRPSSPTISIMAALGLSMTLFASLALTGHSLTGFLHDILPSRAPTYYLLDVPANRIETLNGRFTMNDDFGKLSIAPYLRGHISHIGETPIEEVAVDPKNRWAVRTPLTFSYSYNLSEMGRLVEGHWWANDYDGPTLASVEASLAKSLKLKIGDSISLVVNGYPLQAEINNIREVSWGELAMNFQIVLSPKALRDLPHHYIAAIYALNSSHQRLDEYLRFFLPDVTAINVRQQITGVMGMIDQASRIIWLAAGMTVLGAILVCTSAVFASMQQRLYDVVVLQLLGATRRRLKNILQLEFLLIGLSVAAVSLATGAAGAWAFTRYLLDAPFGIPPLLAGGCIMFGIVLTYNIGMFVSRRALNVRPMQLLRND